MPCGPGSTRPPQLPTHASHPCQRRRRAETWRPDSFYDKVLANRRLGLHTLCLLDIKVKEPSLEALCRGKKIYEPPRFMTVNTAIEQLLEVEERRGEGAFDADSLCVGVARIGADSQQIAAGSMQQLLEVDFGPPLHSLVIVGETHPIEDEILEHFRRGTATPATAADEAGATTAATALAAAAAAAEPAS